MFVITLLRKNFCKLLVMWNIGIVLFTGYTIPPHGFVAPPEPETTGISDESSNLGLSFGGPSKMMFDRNGNRIEVENDLENYWIDIDLSDQTLYVYDGGQLVNLFLVSTGTWRSPTIIGQFRIYEKHVAASMEGPDYYLPAVQNIMYFYQGYGIHAADWHNNFGVPSSHGCVQLKNEDALWLFNHASIGTLVNVHY